MLRRRSESARTVLTWAELGESSYRLDVGRRIRVENDHIVEVGRHLYQTFNEFVYHLDEPAGEALPPWGMTSHSQRPVGVKNAVRRNTPYE